MKSRKMKKILRADIGLPPSVEKGVEKAFEQIRMEAAAKEKRTVRKRRIVPGTALAAALVLILSGVTVAGAVVYSWSPRVAEKFQADQEQQDQLTKEHLTRPLDISVTDGGVTVSLEQVLTVPDYLYLCFKITGPEDMDLTGDISFNSMDFQLVGQKEQADFSWSGHCMEPEEGQSNIRYYEVWGFLQGASYEGMVLDVRLKDLMLSLGKGGDPCETLAQGSWDLSWNVEEIYEGETVQVETALPGSGLTVHTVTVTPISLYMDCDRIRDQNGEDPEWNPVGYCMEDGTTEQFQWELPPREGYKNPAGSPEDTAYEIRQGFEKIYETDEIKGILFCRVNGDEKEYFELELR